MAEVELRFDGVRYGYWQQLELHASVDDLCAGLQLSITRPELGAPTLTENTVVQVYLGGVLVTTVRVDSLRRTVGETSHTIQLTARSLARELVDCQYSQTLKGLKLGEIVKYVCSAFEVPVKVLAKTAVTPDFAMQCESPANALINAARASNLLLYAQPDGGLVLAEPTAAEPVATLVYGLNLTGYTVVADYRLLHSHYTVKGYDYAANTAVVGRVVDKGVTFFRPLHVVADRHGQSPGACTRRAELERNRRRARAHGLMLSVPGWAHSGGLWAVNTQVRVVIPPEGVDATFLVADVSMRLDDQGGAVTQLQVVSRAAFAGQPERRRKRGSGGRR